MGWRGVVVGLLGCACAASAAAPLAGCARPVLARDGTLVFQENGARGAAILTPNGLEFHDRQDVPDPVIARSAHEPWRAPIGFILPADGRFTQTSTPTVLADPSAPAARSTKAEEPGITIALRASDSRVPSWGGEVLVRIDVLAATASGPARWGDDLVVIVEGRGAATQALADVALRRLGARDRVTVVDAQGALVAVPTMPASHRTMVTAAIEQRLARKPPRPTDLAGALRAARGALASANGHKRVLLLTATAKHPPSSAIAAELAALAENGATLTSVLTERGDEDEGTLFDERAREVENAIPESGPPVFRDVVLAFEGTPAPSHVLEASSGDVRWRLDAGELAMGDVRAGDGRTEVVRVSVPAWVPGASFDFTVTAEYDDLRRGGLRRVISARVPCVYDDDIERIAHSRHGDVIAYASALATLKRLDAAFAGPGIERYGGLHALAKLHAESMSHLARDANDPGAYEQAELLKALLKATR